MLGKLVKLSDDRFNGNHPNGIFEGYTKVGEMWSGEPEIGYGLKVGSISTSQVTAIKNENKLVTEIATLNSTYVLYRSPNNDIDELHVIEALHTILNSEESLTIAIDELPVIAFIDLVNILVEFDIVISANNIQPTFLEIDAPWLKEFLYYEVDTWTNTAKLTKL